MQLEWPDFKQVLDQRSMSLQSVVVGDNLWLSAFDNYFKIECLIRGLVGDAYYDDYAANYAASANQKMKSSVVTEFELEDKVLRLASAEGTFDSSGDCVIEVLVPGTFDPLNPSRLIAEAYIVEDVFGWGDRLTEVNIVDLDNILGAGAGYVVETYHDAEMPSSSQGWRFYPTEQSMGEIEVEPVGGFGRIPGGLYIQAKFKRATGNTATKIIADIWWGAKDND